MIPYGIPKYMGYTKGCGYGSPPSTRRPRFGPRVWPNPVRSFCAGAWWGPAGAAGAGGARSPARPAVHGAGAARTPRPCFTSRQECKLSNSAPVPPGSCPSQAGVKHGAVPARRRRTPASAVTSRLAAALAAGESVIECPSPLNRLKDTYTAIAVIGHVHMNICTE